MFSSKKSIIILTSIVFLSCGEDTPTEVNKNIIESTILEQTDSLLNIVDEEFQHIIHDSEVKNEKVNALQDRVERYKNVIVLDKKEQNLLIVKIDSLRRLCSEQDSLNVELTLQIESKNSTIKSIEEREERLKVQIKEQVVLYKSIIYRLEDSLSNYIIGSKIIESENKRRKRNKKQ